jgi:hypothetical protein
MSRMIVNTSQEAKHQWPDDVYLQGGGEGVVITSAGNYRTAFVEAFPSGTFLRGEGATIGEAETRCWEKYQRISTCPTSPTHGPFEARGYTNGSGFCANCGAWFHKVISA